MDRSRSLRDIMERSSLTVIGLMSGTSADGIDAALTSITLNGDGMDVRQRAFVSLPYTDEERRAILRLAEGRDGGARELCLFNAWLGERSLEACRALCERAGIPLSEVDLVGSHGQTLYHIPRPENYLGRLLTSTLQLGEASIIAEGMGCPVVSDFRVRDMAAGGQGAPLVPFAEYLLYRRQDKCVGLQNIGGIGNMTILPNDCAPDEVFAFDTGPGNMVIDQLVGRATGGRLRYDQDGRMASSGHISVELLAWLTDDPYLALRPPKTTGREQYGASYVDTLLAKARELRLTDADALRTATRFTAECVHRAIVDWCDPKPDVLVVGGGGCRNPVLMYDLKEMLDIPVKTNEDLGLDSQAKEAVAFAMLAAACVWGIDNNMPHVTGARGPVIMGKIVQ